jgi:aspartyl/glutamyl-tRNA(Asn/Gln) amidotransferase C subunit
MSGVDLIQAMPNLRPWPLTSIANPSKISVSFFRTYLMANEIDPETFAHLVRLAALELSPAEAEYLRGQLNNQLKAVEELAAIPLELDTPVTLHGVSFTPEIRPPIRPDEWEPFADTEAILEQAPETEERHFVVPEITHTDLM